MRTIRNVVLVLAAIVTVMFAAGHLLPQPGTGPFAPRPVHHRWELVSVWVP